MTLPEPAYKYQIVEAATCDYNPGILSTGSGPRNDETIANVMELDCDNSGALLKVVPNYVDLPQGVREVPRSNPAKLWVRMGSTVKEIDFWGRHPIHLGYYGVHDTYEVRVKKNPVRPIRYLVGTEFVTGHFVCTETPGASTGDGLSYRPPPAVTCTMKREVSCSDGLRSQDEVDVDCGGVCSTRCANNKWCWEYSDCQVSGCVNNRCVDDGNCSDNTHNQDELDVDCGGRCGDATCGDGQRCSTNAHCVSGNCSASGTCLAAACQDMIRNGEETDIDCGGSVCPQCAVSQACTVNSDCATFSCDGATQRCLGATCNDGIKNPGELHADCGGVCPRGCGEGLSCSKNTDCDSNLCTPNNTCGRATCSDGLPNQDESDIDCGGSICQPCGITGQCGRGLRLRQQQLRERKLHRSDLLGRGPERRRDRRRLRRQLRGRLRGQSGLRGGGGLRLEPLHRHAVRRGDLRGQHPESGRSRRRLRRALHVELHDGDLLRQRPEPG